MNENKKPIEQAHDCDLRLSRIALQRAARRAHDLAQKTGTTIVVSHGGVIEYLSPSLDDSQVSRQRPLSAPPNEG